VTLVNESGAQVKTFNAQVGKQSIPAGGLQAGMYYVNIEKDGVSVQKKIVVVE